MYFSFFIPKFSYRSIVLRALPNLEMLDNVGVTSEELADAMKGLHTIQRDEEMYEDAYSNGSGQHHQQQQVYSYSKMNIFILMLHKFVKNRSSSNNN